MTVGGLRVAKCVRDHLALPDAKLPDGALPSGKRPMARGAARRAGLLSAGGVAILRELDRRMDRDGEATTKIPSGHINDTWRTPLASLQGCGYLTLDSEGRAGITPAGDRLLRLAS